MPDGPKPACSTPFIYKNNGITVIGPAKKSKNINEGFEKAKSFVLFWKIKYKITNAKGSMNKLSTNNPTSVSTLIFYLTKL